MKTEKPKKGGRPPRVVGARSSRRIIVRVTAEEHSILKQMAREEGETLAAFVRGRIAESLT